MELYRQTPRGRLMTGPEKVGISVALILSALVILGCRRIAPSVSAARLVSKSWQKQGGVGEISTKKYGQWTVLGTQKPNL
jgi:hypothetical protein